MEGGIAKVKDPRGLILGCPGFGKLAAQRPVRREGEQATIEAELDSRRGLTGRNPGLQVRRLGGEDEAKGAALRLSAADTGRKRCGTEKQSAAGKAHGMPDAGWG